jgi:hypothetical protein
MAAGVSGRRCEIRAQADESLDGREPYAEENSEGDQSSYRFLAYKIAR